MHQFWEMYQSMKPSLRKVLLLGDQIRENVLPGKTTVGADGRKMTSVSCKARFESHQLLLSKTKNERQMWRKRSIILKTTKKKLNLRHRDWKFGANHWASLLRPSFYFWKFSQERSGQNEKFSKRVAVNCLRSNFPASSATTLKRHLAVVLNDGRY